MAITLHVFHEDLQGPASRRLLDWCQSRGADAFTVSVIGTPPGMDGYGADLERRLAAFALPPETVVQVAQGREGSDWTRPAQLWRLTPESADLLWRVLDEDLLTYFAAGDAWCEDPVLYRRGELMLGVVSHEGEGVLRIAPNEQALLDRAEIPYRLRGRWVGY